MPAQQCLQSRICSVLLHICTAHTQRPSMLATCSTLSPCQQILGPKHRMTPLVTCFLPEEQIQTLSIHAADTLTLGKDKRQKSAACTKFAELQRLSFREAALGKVTWWNVNKTSRITLKAQGCFSKPTSQCISLRGSNYKGFGNGIKSQKKS